MAKIITSKLSNTTQHINIDSVEEIVKENKKIILIRKDGENIKWKYSSNLLRDIEYDDIIKNLT